MPINIYIYIYIYKIVKLMSFQSNNGLRKFTTHTKKKKKSKFIGILYNREI